MSWLTYLLMGGLILGIIAAVITNLEKIARPLGWMANQVFRWHYRYNATWPLKPTIRKIQMYDLPLPLPNVSVELLAEPRKSLVLGRCKLVAQGLQWETDAGSGWDIGNRIDAPTTYNLKFRAPYLNLPSRLQLGIEIESEGRWCKSNLEIVDK